MYTQRRRVTNTSTWVASSDLANLDLPRDGIITEIKLRAAVTMSAALTAIQPDGLTRVIQNFKLEGDGGRGFYSFSGEQMGRLMFLMSMYDNHAPLIDLQTYQPGLITWVLHPGSNPRDPFDTTVVIPAKNLSTLVAKLTTTANSVVDDTTTISSAVYSYEVSQVMDMPVNPGMLVPLGSSQTIAGDATYSGFQKTVDCPTGGYLRRIFILAQDETATRPIRKDDEITELKLFHPASGKVFIETNWEDLKAEYFKNARMPGYPFLAADVVTGHMQIPQGLAVIDLRKMKGPGFDPIRGMDLVAAQTGAVKLGLTIGAYTAGDDYLFYWDMLQAMPPAWAK